MSNNYDFLSYPEYDVDKVFKERIKCTHEEHEFLLFKAYNNLAKGCIIKSIDLQVPEDEIDTYKQYDHQMRVIFESPNLEDHVIYISHHFSGNEKGRMYRAKYLHEKEKVEELKSKISYYGKAIEFSRQHYHLPQDVYDVFSKVQPDSVEFDREELLRDD